MVDLFLPPALLWFLLPLSWFVAMGAASSLLGLRLAGQPGVLGSIGLTLAAFLTGAMVLGPLASAPLILPPAYAFLRAVWMGAPDLSGRPRRVLLAIGTAHLLAIAAGVAILIHTQLTRTDSAYICQWPDTALGRSKFRDLRVLEPASLPQYRYIAEHASGPLVGDAADRLAEIGNPSEDDPVLDRALGRNAADSDLAGRIVMARRRLDQRSRIESPRPAPRG